MKFKIFNIILVAALVLVACAYFFLGKAISLWVPVGLLFFYSLVIFLGCIKVSWSFFLPVRCKGVTREKIVALTFDDGPHPENTIRVLAILKEYGVTAAFFCIGKNIAAHPDIAKSTAEGGHIIGNHSYSHHFWFDMFTSQKMLQDLQAADQLVKHIAGYEPLMFRPPYGVTNPNLAKAVQRGKYIAVGWSIRSMDTVSKSKEALLAKIEQQLHPGAVILLHDSIDLTVEALPEIINSITAKGYSVVGLDSLLGVDFKR